jgi:uncharacterized membrane protein YgcG
MKRILLLVITMTFFLFPTGARAAEDTKITSFDVNIAVKIDNTYDVKESLVRQYGESPPMHGIERMIDLRPEVIYEYAGQVVSRKYRVIVDSVHVNQPCEVFREGDFFGIRIGDPDVYVNGQTIPYEISYTYDAGDDRVSEFDMLYFGIIGNDWDVPIENVSFHISMPKEFDASKMGFSVGSDGARGYNPETLEFETQGNEITGRFYGILAPGEGIWIRIELPEGYFVGARTEEDALAGFFVTFFCITGAVFVLFLIFRRKEKPVVTVEFYPPEGMTSADVGFVVDGLVEDRDVVSLLIYWADRGYIEIHEGKKKKEMIFKRIGDLPEDANEYEKLMFSNLFSNGDETSTTKLQYRFYGTISATKTRIRTKYELESNRVFQKTSQLLQNVICMLAAFPLAGMFGLTFYSWDGEWTSSVIIGIIVFFIAYACSKKFVRLENRWESEKLSAKTGSVIGWVAATAGLYGVVMLLSYQTFGKWVWFAPLCGVLMTLMAPFFRKRTAQGNLWLGRILGLKNFINTVEAKKLKMLVEEDPTYFYNVLPYAYVLGISDKWAKQFEKIAIEPPSWYYGGEWSTFSTVYFTSMLMSSMVHAQTLMAAKPSSEGSSGNFGGGGFSGGGFSGGGFGGGGGRGW